MQNNLTTLMNQIFDDSYFPAMRVSSGKILSSPALNVVEQKDGYQISLKIPGIDPKEVSVELNDKVLSLSYQHTQESTDEDKAGQYLRQEYSFNSFNRSVVLPKNVDSSSVKASYQKGILTVEVSKLPESQPKKIDIEIKE